MTLDPSTRTHLRQVFSGSDLGRARTESAGDSSATLFAKLSPDDRAALERRTGKTLAGPSLLGAVAARVSHDMGFDLDMDAARQVAHHIAVHAQRALNPNSGVRTTEIRWPAALPYVVPSDIQVAYNMALELFQGHIGRHMSDEGREVLRQVVKRAASRVDKAA